MNTYSKFLKDEIDFLSKMIGDIELGQYDYLLQVGSGYDPKYRELRVRMLKQDIAFYSDELDKL